VHPAAFPVKDGFTNQPSPRESPQDATEEYPQPRRAVQVVCLPKSHLTTSYRWFLARWAKRPSRRVVADALRTSWENVFRSVKMAVSWGLAHRGWEGIASIGVDEIQWQKGHRCLTLVYQIDPQAKRLARDGYEAVLKHSRWCLLKRPEKLTDKQTVKIKEILQYKLILNWFKAKGTISAAVVEGLNNKVNEKSVWLPHPESH
jgi:hypothetical protein